MCCHQYANVPMLLCRAQGESIKVTAAPPKERFDNVNKIATDIRGEVTSGRDKVSPAFELSYGDALVKVPCKLFEPAQLEAKSRDGRPYKIDMRKPGKPLPSTSPCAHCPNMCRPDGTTRQR